MIAPVKSTVMPPGTMWRIAFKTPGFATDAFETLLDRFAGAISSNTGVNDALWTVEGFSDAEPDKAAIQTAVAALARDLDVDPPKVLFDLEPTIDWLTHNLTAFPPVSWGRFWIAGSHIEDPVPPGRIALRIDAGTAFGSGEHPTTGGCLTLIQRHARRRPAPRRILDLGCGSGILGIGAAKTWNACVTATDIDPESVRVTRHHASLNRLNSRVTAFVSDGYANVKIRERGPYDLIVANILARPLARMASSMAHNLAPDGAAIISGLLSRDGPWMAASHRYAGLHIADRVEIDGWLTLMLRR